MTSENVHVLLHHTPYSGTSTHSNSPVTPYGQAAIIRERNEELQNTFREWRRAWDTYHLRVEDYFTAITHCQESFAARSRYCDNGLYQDLTDTVEASRQGVLHAERNADDASRRYEIAKSALKDAEEGNANMEMCVPRRVVAEAAISASHDGV